VAHGVPSTGELATAVREFLQNDVMTTADARVRFLARVAANVMGQIERECALGEQHAHAHAERLSALGVADDEALAQAIREGALGDRSDDVLAATRAGVVEKLRIANPRYLRPEDQG
jgi:hypothetical protein